MFIFKISDHFEPIINKIMFGFIVIGRCFKILFRRNRSIQKDYLDFSTEHIFENSYLVIRYNFKNALWYNFKGIKKTTKKTPLVLDTANIDATDITLVVQGLFRKKKYKISVEPSLTINTKSFKVKPINLQIENSFMLELKIALKEIEMTQKQIIVKQKNIHLNHSSFKQTDFL